MPYPYTWATNPGTRVAPSAGEQASGFIDGTPSTPLVLNAVLGEIVDILDPLDTAFAAQHNPTTGVHTNVIGVQAVFSSAVSSPSYAFPSPGLLSYQNKFVRQGFAFGDGAISQESVGPAGENRMAVITLDAGEFCYLDLGDVGANTDFDGGTLYWSMGVSTLYSIDWELREVDLANATYDTISTGATGNLAGTSGAGVSEIVVSRSISFPDLNSPNVAGHGVHFSTVTSTMLRLENSGAAPVEIFCFQRAVWLYDMINAVGVI